MKKMIVLIYLLSTYSTVFANTKLTIYDEIMDQARSVLIESKGKYSFSLFTQLYKDTEAYRQSGFLPNLSVKWINKKYLADMDMETQTIRSTLKVIDHTNKITYNCTEEIVFGNFVNEASFPEIAKRMVLHRKSADAAESVTHYYYCNSIFGKKQIGVSQKNYIKRAFNQSNQ